MSHHIDFEPVGRREFVLVGEEEQAGQPAITVTQRDVRALQLAKGAIRTGIQVLLESQGLTAESIDQVVIAGSFGSYIDASSAVSIGMLPALPPDRFRQVGNATGMGPDWPSPGAASAPRRRPSPGGSAISNWQPYRDSCNTLRRRWSWSAVDGLKATSPMSSNRCTRGRDRKRRHRTMRGYSGTVDHLVLVPTLLMLDVAYRKRGRGITNSHRMSAAARPPPHHRGSGDSPRHATRDEA